MTPEQAVTLFSVSALKQRKWRALTERLGPTDGLRCLDLGGDNGIISYLLRRRGGSWASADLEARTVEAIRSLVGSEVYQVDGVTTPFVDEEFDRVLIVDFLEHIRTDREFIRELFRIMRPGGVLIINVPHRKESWLRRVRHWIGQTDARHGHLRSGYTVEDLQTVLHGYFTMTSAATYSKFFSEAIDTLITWAHGIVSRKGQQAVSRKGTVITAADLASHGRLFQLYRLLYPAVWLVSRLDHLLFWRSGYMLVAAAQVVKRERRPAEAVTARAAGAG